MGIEVRDAPVSITGTLTTTNFASPSPSMIITLARVHEDENPKTLVEQGHINNNGSTGKRQAKRPADCSSDEEQNLLKALRHRPWISYQESETSSEDECDSEQVHAASVRSSSLPVGVVRGCPTCSSCQRVLARWRPEAGCRPSLDEVPVFFPLEEEFRDALKYIASISAEAEPYGICRIVPPQSWRPPCPLRDCQKRQTTRFPTRVQQIHKLQVREAQSKRYSQIKKRKRGRPRMGGPMGRRSLVFAEGNKMVKCSSPDEDDKFGFEPGPDFTLEAFEKYALQFKEEYFGPGDVNLGCGDSKKKWEPSIESIEGEYWRIVEQATEQIEVLYGADVETGDFGSGFPKTKLGTEPTSYESSAWNLNNIARFPGSVLAFEEGDISGVLVPWLYVGMCFSSFCWHVEDHHFYSLNYMHWGSPKVWYGVPSSAASKLEEAMKQHLPDLFEEQPDLLHKLVTQMSPSVLKAAGVPVYRAVQKAGEFIVTFPRAYHAGFNCGFNCAEAVNLAPVDWLPHGQSAVELYRKQRRKTSVSHDKLLLGSAKQAVGTLQQLQDIKDDKELKFGLSKWQDLLGQGGVLAKSLKKRVDTERLRRSALVNIVHTRKMDVDFDATHERECFVCRYDLHLSAIGCECYPGRYACLEHAQLLCACGQLRKFALYRYDILELDTLVAALEGQPGAVSRWFGQEKETRFKFSPSADVKFSKQSLDGLSTPMVSAQWISDNGAHEIGLTSSGYYMNQQDLDLCNSKPFRQGLQDHSHSKRETQIPMAHDVQKVGPIEVTILNSEPDSRHEKVITPDLVRDVGRCGSREDAFPGQKPEIGMTEFCFSSSAKVELKLDCSFQKAQEERNKCEGESGDEEKVSASLGQYSSLCAVNRQVSPSGSDMALIVLSDDEDGNTCDGNAACFRQGIQNFTKPEGPILDGFPKKVAHELKSEEPLVVALKKEQFNGEYQNASNKCSRFSIGEADQIRLMVSSSAVEPQCGIKSQNAIEMCQHSVPSHTVDKNNRQFDRTGKNTEFLYDRLLESPESKSINGSLLPRRNLKLQELGREAILDCTQSKRQEVCKSILSPNCERASTLDRNLGNDTAGAVGCSISAQIHTGFQVELLNVGRLELRKCWSNKHAIFPAGFRSRVLFCSILQPSQLCFYNSEILDCGLPEPLFKVTMEGQPTEVFIHPNIDKCWQMVGERLNTTIQLQHDLHKPNMPLLQPVDNLWGLELFGFTSPHIIKAVESLDWQHQCIEYWAGRLSAVELLESQHRIRASCVHGTQCTERCDISQKPLNASTCKACVGDGQVHSFSAAIGSNPEEDSGECSSRVRESGYGHPQSNRKLYYTLRGLFKKATQDELWMLHRLFGSEWEGLDWKEGFKALKDELAAIC